MIHTDLLLPLLAVLTVLPAAGLLAARLLARRRPAHAHTVLVASLAATIVGPFALFGAAARGWSWRAAPVIEAKTGFAAPSGLVAELAAAAGRGTVLPWILGAGIALSLIFLVRFAWAYAAAASTARRAEPVSDASFSALSAERLRRAGVRAVRSSAVSGPAIFAWTRVPVLLLNDRALALPEVRLDAVVLHELHHLRRRDHWWRLLADVAVAFLPWHPLVHALRRAIARTSESACDAVVLEHGVSPVSYADTLLQFVAPRSLGLPAFAATTSSVGRRIEQVLDPRRRHRAQHGVVWPAAVALVAATATAVLATTTTPAPIPSALPTAAILAAAPVVAFPSVLDLGTPAAGLEFKDGVVYLLNAGTRPIRLERVRTSCGCTTAPDFTASTLVPGAQIEVPIRMTTGATDKVRRVTFLFDDQVPLEIDVQLAALPAN